MRRGESRWRALLQRLWRQAGRSRDPRRRRESASLHAAAPRGADPPLAQALFREVHSAALRQGHLASEFASQVGYASLLRLRGDGAAALARARAVIARADAVGSPYWLVGGLQALFYADAVIGDWRAVLADYGEVAARAPVRVQAFEPTHAEALLRLGDRAAARELAHRLQPLLLGSFSEDQLGPTHRFSARLSVARVLLALDGPDSREAVEALLDYQSVRVRRDESTIGASYVALERAALARALGNERDWRSQLALARAGFAAAPAPRLVDEVDRELARGMGAGAG